MTEKLTIQDNNEIQECPKLFNGNINSTINIGIYLTPEFSLVSLSGIIEPLRIANSMINNNIKTDNNINCDKKFFQWDLINADGGQVLSSSELPVMVNKEVAKAELYDIVVVISGFNPMQYTNDTMENWLRKCYNNGADIWAIDTGSYLLANSKLLNKKHITMHWDGKNSFEQSFEMVKSVTNELWESDGRIHTCSGGIGTTDMVIELIKQTVGNKIKISVSEQLVYTNFRDKSANQRAEIKRRYNIKDNAIIRALTIMNDNISEPLSLDEISNMIGLHPRTLQKHFKKIINDTFINQYMKIRLEKSHQLLKETSISIGEIAYICGYQSYSNFQQSFKKHYNKTPNEIRKNIYKNNG